jgi:probable F420-dependent oxidoreductase
MAQSRQFRFGIQLTSAPTGADWAALARKAEDLGYSSLLLPDHFGDQLAPIPAMVAAADATTDLRVGALVFDNDYRHPVMLAKEIATVDVLSGGRVELGLGAGWMNTDYEQSGITKDPAGVRIERMVEGLQVLRGLFADGRFSFDGKHYRISDLDGLPKPAQKPHPPVIIGGGGRKVLSIAAREADIVGIAPAATTGAVDAETARNAAAEFTDQKVAWVREAAGARYDDIEMNVLVFACIVTDDRQGTAEMLAPAFGSTADELLQSPHALMGPIDAMCDDLEARRDRWDISYVVFQGDALETAAPVVARLAGT